jgi:hypothetical protein
MIGEGFGCWSGIIFLHHESEPVAAYVSATKAAVEGGGVVHRRVVNKANVRGHRTGGGRGPLERVLRQQQLLQDCCQDCRHLIFSDQLSAVIMPLIWAIRSSSTRH